MAGSTKGKGGEWTPAQLQREIVAFVTEHRQPISATETVNWMQSKNKAGKSKVKVDRALDAAVADGQLVMKAFGRSKLFWAEIPIPTAEQTAELNTKRTYIREANVRIVEMKEQQQQLEDRTRQLLKEPTDAEIDDLLEKRRAEVAALEQRLKDNEEAVGTIDEEANKRTDAELLYLVKLWKTRRMAVMDVINQMSEGRDKPVPDLLEEFGLETDEEAGVSLADVQGLLGIGSKRAR
ncbi:Homologous-pairing protein 2 [Carpediemonas membranifera]|uniref:Homologous-pairing protein 2 n=1 Tax=Carpediemonas membranifera TaxID=201153 RepID=A0A8J6C066_9EUKA|nr:Homologous-pairing protein 2 [Carpediemonas membranifera]|eukprot:KAG9396261.1 Homologous-pairing protein 2 [Carpediemonas membranifera]